MTRIDEIAADIFRISTYASDFDITESDVVGAFRETAKAFQATPMCNYMPYTPQTESQIRAIASLKPRICATMHGSTFVGNGEQALLDMAVAMKEVLG